MAKNLVIDSECKENHTGNLYIENLIKYEILSDGQIILNILGRERKESKISKKKMVRL